jgi:hypothetical protein
LYVAGRRALWRAFCRLSLALNPPRLLPGMLGEPIIVFGDAKHHVPRHGVAPLLRRQARGVGATAPVVGIVEYSGLRPSHAPTPRSKASHSANAIPFFILVMPLGRFLKRWFDSMLSLSTIARILFFWTTTCRVVWAAFSGCSTPNPLHGCYKKGGRNVATFELAVTHGSWPIKACNVSVHVGKATAASAASIAFFAFVKMCVSVESNNQGNNQKAIKL